MLFSWWEEKATKHLFNLLRLADKHVINEKLIISSVCLCQPSSIYALTMIHVRKLKIEWHNQVSGFECSFSCNDMTKKYFRNRNLRHSWYITKCTLLGNHPCDFAMDELPHKRSI